MKKLVLIVAFALIGSSAFGQGFNLGLNLGFPTGDAGDAYTFTIGVDLHYMWDVSDTFTAGVASGYSHFLGDEIDLGSFGTIDVDDAGFIPLAAAGRLSLSDSFVLGADLGYAIGVSPDGNDGGFYYRPMLGYNISDSMQITASYRGVSVDGGSIDAVTAGINFAL